MGRWFHLSLILDLYSRKIVGWEVHDSDDADHAVHLVRRTALAEGIAAMTTKPVLHGDNGSTLKATTVLAMLNWLGVKPSYSWPRVSDDNAYAESLFRTAKYRPEFPAKGFADLDAARTWAAAFVRWYNHDHRYSGIRYVSPAQRHVGEDRAILAARHDLYLNAQQSNPARWSGNTATGRPSVPSRSTLNVTPCSTSQRLNILRHEERWLRLFEHGTGFDKWSPAWLFESENLVYGIQIAAAG